MSPSKTPPCKPPGAAQELKQLPLICKLSSASIRGFSLVEVTLALGVIAFALVGIMAMFPIAMQTARESRQETRATFIAQTIFATLQAGPSPTNRVLFVAADDAAQNRLPVNLSAPTQFVIGFDEEGIPTGTNTPGTFSNQIANPNWVYATRVSISTNDLMEGLSRVEVEVTAPAAAALANRSRYPFITLLRNQ